MTEEDTGARVRIVAGGPYVVEGGLPLAWKLPVHTEHGEPIAWRAGPPLDQGAGTYALCRCGGSANKPFCDGTLAPEGADVEPDLARKVNVVADGPLWVTGGVPVESSRGGTLETRNRVTLCRCGGSANKPHCDGTHKKLGFSHRPEEA